jgi:hypothetical protein
MRNSVTIATALALILLIPAAGPGLTAPTASADQQTKQKSRPAPGTTPYGPVAKSQLLGEFTCSATGSKRAYFRLACTDDRFEMKGDKGPIPREVLETVLGVGKKAEKIEARWDLAAGKLTLIEIRADGKFGFQNVTLHPFRTGPNIVRVVIGGTQYILHPNPKTKGPSGRE